MSPIQNTTGYLVTDSRGREIGQVECPMYGRAEARPDSLAVCSRGRPFRHHYVVPAESIRAIDRRSRFIRLGLEQRQLIRFL